MLKTTSLLNNYDVRMIHAGLALDWSFDPLEALARYDGCGGTVMMLHSGRFDARWSRYTILTHAHGALRVTLDEADQPRTQWVGEPLPVVGQAAGSSAGTPFEPTHRPFADLRRVLRDDQAMWIGYLGYDLGRLIEKLPHHAGEDRFWPVLQLHRCPGWLVFDGQTRRWFACGNWREGGYPKLDQQPTILGSFTATTPQPLLAREDYLHRIQRVKDYIAAGDVFQVNLTQRFTSRFQGDPRALFTSLAKASPAWYGAYIEMLPATPDEPRRTLASTSPELFFELDAQGSVVTRPIKGTRPAHVDAAVLRDSIKDQAELNMIVDLLRNDLGRVCDYGSIQVTEPRRIESHPTIHHGVATIRGRLHQQRDLVHLIRALMPGGSITGAPKVRAMQIIDELEPVRRGPYCGAIGWIHQQQACFNIAIRTLLIQTDAARQGTPGEAGHTGTPGEPGGLVDFNVGGGIVADSVPAEEYQETLDKAAALHRALGGA